MTRSTLRILGLLAALTGSAASACAAKQAPPLALGAADPASGASTPARGGASVAAPTSVRTSRDVVRETTVSLRARAPGELIERARRWFESHDGFVDVSSTLGSGGPSTTSRATFRVASARHDEAVRYLRTLGEALEITERGDDVTAERADSEARLAAKRQLERRLLALTDHAASVAELIQVENELGRVRGEIESMEAARRGLEGRIAYATILVEVRAPDQPLVASAESAGSLIANAFRRGRGAALDVVSTTIVLGTALSPLVLLGLAAWLARRGLRRRAAGLAGASL